MALVLSKGCSTCTATFRDHSRLRLVTFFLPKLAQKAAEDTDKVWRNLKTSGHLAVHGKGRERGRKVRMGRKGNPNLGAARGEQTVAAPRMFHLLFAHLVARSLTDGVRWGDQKTYQDQVHFALDRLSVGKTRKTRRVRAKICLEGAQCLEDGLCLLASGREGVGMGWRSPSIPGGLSS